MKSFDVFIYAQVEYLSISYTQVYKKRTEYYDVKSMRIVGGSVCYLYLRSGKDRTRGKLCDIFKI